MPANAHLTCSFPANSDNNTKKSVVGLGVWVWSWLLPASFSATECTELYLHLCPPLYCPLRSISICAKIEPPRSPNAYGRNHVCANSLVVHILRYRRCRRSNESATRRMIPNRVTCCALCLAGIVAESATLALLVRASVGRLCSCVSESDHLSESFLRSAVRAGQPQPRA